MNFCCSHATNATIKTFAICRCPAVKHQNYAESSAEESKVEDTDLDGEDDDESPKKSTRTKKSKIIVLKTKSIPPATTRRTRAQTEEAEHRCLPRIHSVFDFA